MTSILETKSRGFPARHGVLASIFLARDFFVSRRCIARRVRASSLASEGSEDGGEDQPHRSYQVKYIKSNQIKYNIDGTHPLDGARGSPTYRRPRARALGLRDTPQVSVEAHITTQHRGPSRFSLDKLPISPGPPTATAAMTPL